tara:strand:- start:174 stop:578 length:405 start_codon:yes stop_codon:yes gene_type:complete
MAKSKKPRKKYVQKDGAGNPTNSRTKKHVTSAKRGMMFRALTIQNASNSLSAKELEALLTQAIERRDSTEAVKGPWPVLTYIETKLDENNVPVGGETKELPISSSDIPRISSILGMKKQDEEVANTAAEQTKAV